LKVRERQNEKKNERKTQFAIRKTHFHYNSFFFAGRLALHFKNDL
jgi:hypothetical protein